MTYYISIKTAVIIFPILAFLTTGPYILFQYHKYSSISPLKTIIIYSFIFYLLCAYFLVILPLPSVESIKNNPNFMIEWIPFHFIVDFLKETPLILSDPSTYLKALLHPSFYVVLLNILLFVPFGMFLRYYKRYSLKKVIFYSFFLSLFFEFTQLTRLYGLYPKPYRLCDIDDLILNTLGGVVGYLWLEDLEPRIPSKEKLDELSYQKGEKVSSLRRITLFFLDLFLYSIATIFSKGLHPVIIFILYFTVIPLLFKNRTLGSAFLNIKITKEKDSILYYLRPYFIYFYYLILPYIILSITSSITSNITNTNLKLMITLALIMLIIILFLFYIINIFLLFIHKEPFYDKIFNTKLENTMKKTV